jgi:hypothetical protein
MINDSNSAEHLLSSAKHRVPRCITSLRRAWSEARNGARDGTQVAAGTMNC